MLLQLQIFLIIAVLLIAKPAGSAIFLARFGPENLPYMFILTAIVAAIISTTYASAIRYYSLLRVNLWSLVICMGSLLGFALMLSNPLLADLVAVGLYTWVALFGVLAASQFWMMANMVFDVRQAKRLFGPIGAGAIAGGIVGGYAANLVAVALGLKYLLLIAVGCLLPVIVISVFVWRRYIRENHPNRKENDTLAKAITERPHQIIAGSKHLQLLCAIIALSVITAKLVDYQFSALAAERFASPDRLTSFFGFWFSTFNVIGLLIQLLITQRVVRWVGISGALFVLPAGLSIGAMTMFLLPGLGAATFSRLTDGSLKQSLHRAGVEMLFLPVSKEIKNRIKIYIDVLIDSLAGGVGGLLILLLTAVGVSSIGISGLVLVLSVGWGVCVLLVREEYVAAFREQLSHLRPRRKDRPLKSRHREVLSGFMQVLEEAKLGKGEQQALYVLERTDDLTEERFREPIEALLYSPQPMIRARALRSLSLRIAPNLLPRVLPLLSDPEDRVKNAAMEYLVTHHLEETEELILEQLKHPDATIGGTTLVHLLLETRNNPALRQRWELKKMFRKRVKELPWHAPEERDAWREKLLIAAGRAGGKIGTDFIRRELNGPDPKFRKKAILATGENLDEQWVFPLIDYLSETEYRPFASSVLVQYGDRLLTILPRFLKEDIIDIEDLRRLPGVLEKINSQRVVDLLFAFIERYYPEDLELRLEVLRALNKIQLDFPRIVMPAKRIYRHLLTEVRNCKRCIANMDIQRKLMPVEKGGLREARTGLLNRLTKRQEGNMDRLFRLLGLRYPPADIIPAYRGLRSANHDEKISALEFLDIMLESNLKQLLIPVMEYGIRVSESQARPESDALEDLRKREFTHLRRMLGGTDIRLKLASIHLIGYLDEEQYEPLLARCLGARDKRVRDTASKVMGKMVAK